jgi:hypothetical protein
VRDIPKEAEDVHLFDMATAAFSAAEGEEKDGTTMGICV